MWREDARGAINRAYYAIFDSTSAALLWLDIERSKHSGIQAAFNQFLVKPGMIEDEYSQIYKETHDWRDEQDYKDLVRPLDQATTTQIVHDAERFVTRLERYLRQVGAIEYSQTVPAYPGAESQHKSKMIPHSPRHPRQVYGVDFSGAAKAGKKIWIARGVIEESLLRIEACYRAADLPGSSAPAAQGQAGQDRDRCLAALRDFVQKETASAFGFDFPFGLPRDLVAEDSWEDFVLSFPDRYASPEEFRQTCRQAAGDSELRRVTDQESRTPFSPYNLRLYRQTYFGIRDVLAPLVREQQACVLPMQTALPGRAWVMEICPASTLKQESLNRSYKGKGQGRYVTRDYILAEIERRASLSIPKPLRSAILEDPEGDALDSVVAASAVFRAIGDPGRLAVGGNDVYALEGYVYV